MMKQDLKQKMEELVIDWWGNLTEEQKTAIKLLKFSPSVIGSMFFFDSNIANQCAIEDYENLRQALVEHGIGRKDFSCGIHWDAFHVREQQCRDIEKSIANNDLIRKLPDNLKNEVVNNLLRQDEVWNSYRSKNIEVLKEARKGMFWAAVKELRKKVEG